MHFGTANSIIRGFGEHHAAARGRPPEARYYDDCVAVEDRARAITPAILLAGLRRAWTVLTRAAWIARAMACQETQHAPIDAGRGTGT